MRLIAKCRTSAVTFRSAFRSSITNRMNIVFSSLTTVVTIGVLFLVFRTAFAQTGSVHGVTFSAAMWSLATYAFAWGLGTKSIASDMAQMVKDGSIETRLVRPQHVLQYVVAFRFGRQANVFLVQPLVNIVMVLFLVGVPLIPLSALWWAEIVLLFVCGTVLAVLMYLCVGLGAFWMEDVKPVIWMTDKATMILGGALVPVAMLPMVMQRVSEWSPFGAIMSFARAFAPNFHERFLALLLPQLLWIGVFGFGCCVLWSLARKRIAINGG